MRRFVAILLVISIAFTTSACIIEEPGSGPGHDRWWDWHPGRCR